VTPTLSGGRLGLVGNCRTLVSRSDPVLGFVRLRQRFVCGSQAGGTHRPAAGGRAPAGRAGRGAAQCERHSGSISASMRRRRPPRLSAVTGCRSSAAEAT
jgi:hypothetical protein